MTGYKPNYTFLTNVGITFDDSEHKKPIINLDSFESEIKGLYLAGVIVTGLNTSKLFIENTRHHADVIIRNIELKESIA